MARSAGLDHLGIEGWAAAAPIGFATQAPNRAVEAGGAIASTPVPIDWQLVYRMVNLWERLRSRCGTAVSYSLRDGLGIDGLSRAPATLLARIPPALLASLLVHDGQIDSGAGTVGLLFAGARLLSFDEIASAASEIGAGNEQLLPLTTLVGFQRLAIRADGQVVMCAGFNTHVKSKSFATLLERVLIDTV